MQQTTQVGRARKTPGAIRAFTFMLLSGALAVLTPALADETDPAGCCVCDCRPDPAATSGGAPPGAPEGSVCIETSSAACAEVCQLEDCVPNFFEPIACSEVAGCSQAGTMAPTVSPFVLGIIALALAALGIYATRKAAGAPVE